MAAVVIIDTPRGKILTLDPKGKLAILQDWKPVGEDKERAQTRAADAVTHLRKLAEKEGNRAGKRKIGEVEADGFLVQDEAARRGPCGSTRRRMPRS